MWNMQLVFLHPLQPLVSLDHRFFSPHLPDDNADSWGLSIGSLVYSLRHHPNPSEVPSALQQGAAWSENDTTPCPPCLQDHILDGNVTIAPKVRYPPAAGQIQWRRHGKTRTVVAITNSSIGVYFFSMPVPWSTLYLSNFKTDSWPNWLTFGSSVIKNGWQGNPRT